MHSREDVGCRKQSPPVPALKHFDDFLTSILKRYGLLNKCVFFISAVKLYNENIRNPDSFVKMRHSKILERGLHMLMNLLTSYGTYTPAAEGVIGSFKFNYFPNLHRIAEKKTAS